MGHQWGKIPTPDLERLGKIPTLEEDGRWFQG